MKRVLLSLPAVLMVIILLALPLGGCSTVEDAAAPVADYGGDVQKEAAREQRYEEADASPQAEITAFSEEGESAPDTAVNDEEDVEERIIKEGRIEYVSDDVEGKVEEVEEVVEDHNGYIQDSSLRHINDRSRGRLKIRIESKDFDELYNALGQLDELVEKESSAEDITMEYVDLQRRLDVYREQEERYLDMLNKAESVEEMIEVESELERVRMEIELLEGRLIYYDSVTDYSHIEVRVEQREAVAAAMKTPDNIWEEFAFSLAEGWQFFSAVVVGITAALIWGAPFIISGGIVIFLVMYLRRRRKNLHKENNTISQGSNLKDES